MDIEINQSNGKQSDNTTKDDNSATNLTTVPTINLNLSRNINKTIDKTISTGSCSTSGDNKKQDQQKQATKTSIQKSVQKRRQHSIKDLFGDSSDDEEDDADIRRLLAEQGSINIQYPIKIPIVLKNSINKIDSINESNLKTTKTTESDKSKITTPPKSDFTDREESACVDTNRWIAVDSTGALEQASMTTTTTTSSVNKWKSIESNVVIDKCDESCAQSKWKHIV